MRTWTKSACVVLAWIVLPIILVAVGMKGSAHQAQANTRTAGSTTEVILTSTSSAATAPVTATRHTTRYVVRSGDTLSGIAARFGVRGGWPALYAANRRAIGPDPNSIHSGTVLVLPGHKTPVRYTVAAGDTLSGIAAEFGVRGGWPALYAANRRGVGPDPNVIHAGSVLTFPSPAPTHPTPGRAIRRYHRPAPPPSPLTGPRHHPLPVTHEAPTAAGMPQWLKTMLLAVGLLILAAFLAEPVLVVRRRRQQAAIQAVPSPRAAVSEPYRAVSTPCTAVSERCAPGFGQGPGYRRPSAGRPHIILADHDRLVVTRNMRDDTVYVLRPPGEDPKAILRVARLVLPEGSYGELAKQLGMPAIGPVE
jgi:LysM repeat protein